MMAPVIQEFGFAPDYIMYEMTLPQLQMWYRRAQELKTGVMVNDPVKEESEAEIKSRFRKVDGKWQ